MHLTGLAAGLRWGRCSHRLHDLRQSTRLKLIPSCLAGRVIGLGNSGLLAPDYFSPAIIREKLEATLTLDGSGWNVIFPLSFVN